MAIQNCRSAKCKGAVSSNQLSTSALSCSTLAHSSERRLLLTTKTTTKPVAFHLNLTVMLVVSQDPTTNNSIAVDKLVLISRFILQLLPHISIMSTARMNQSWTRQIKVVPTSTRRLVKTSRRCQNDVVRAICLCYEKYIVKVLILFCRMQTFFLTLTWKKKEKEITNQPDDN